ncbi:universal stress protein [Natronogracilivirga saccharolytica]|uniref:Universal stress protein n=1 Tax=Natronogracilivirga saccharolytica TaxID=2812953 RepID=A0A8J7UV64_9BACT|nr:universal stress protein [Natronogracilivirga saccharolytica]MBP3192242.1 universal stress protein [Natronogracilivirga saccharolytica]
MKHIKILVPVDFSELSEHALKAAALYARTFDGTVTPFHAYIPVTDLDGFYYVGSGITPHEKYGQIENVLRQRLNETALKYVTDEFLNEPLLDVGNPARAITYNAKDFDLVIMSTHGRTGFSRFVMGSVTEKVLRMCNKPMITVTDKSEMGDLASILLTTDFSENSYQVFPFALSLAEKTGGKIDLVHIVSIEQFFDAKAAEKTASEREQQINDLADKHFKDIRDQVTPRVISGNRKPQAEICKLAKEKNYNLIFMSSVGRSGLEYLMMGSTASYVVRTVDNAVFTVNPQGISAEKAKKIHFDYRNL